MINDYNMTAGGYNIDKHSEITKQQMSENIKKSWTTERRKAQSERIYGRNNPAHGGHSKETIENIRQNKLGKNAYTNRYKITYPDGSEEIVTNLKKFMREHNVGHLYSCASGKRKQSRGYTAELLGRN